MTKKKKIYICGFLIVLCFISGIIYFIISSPKGNSIESREELLNTAISKGENWTITRETEIDGYIISGAYSSNGKSTIAVFKPGSNGTYIFSTSINRNNDDIIVGGANINGYWYDLVWFNGAQTEYAEIIYIINGKKNETLRYDTTNMDIIYNKNPQKQYSMEIYYYDQKGNRYE